MSTGFAAPINAILTCEKIAQFNQILLYFFPRVGVAFRYGHPTTVPRRSPCQPDVWPDYRSAESGEEWTIWVQTFEISSLAFEKTEVPYKPKFQISEFGLNQRRSRRRVSRGSYYSHAHIIYLKTDRSPEPSGGYGQKSHGGHGCREH